MFKRNGETDYSEDPARAPAWAKYAVVVAAIAVCVALIQISLNVGRAGVVHVIERPHLPDPAPMSGQAPEPSGDARLGEMLNLARSGSPDAAYWLGVWYAGSAAEPQTSFKWMKVAAEGGVREAVVGMARLYEIGYGRAPDRIRSAAWYQLAFEVGAIEERWFRQWQGWMRDVDLRRADGVAEIYRHQVLTNARRRHAAFGSASTRIPPPFPLEAAAAAL